MTDADAVVAQARAAVAAGRRKRTSAVPLWLSIVIVVLMVFNGLPFLAPLFMQIGWEGPARAIYFVYSGLCHQMAQRSFFLFGPGGFQMYSMAELPMNLSGLSDGERLLALRGFVGSEAMGWKVAWSDRMVYMYLSPLLLSIGYAFLRRWRRIRPLPVWAFIVLLLPMAIDGGTHAISDLAGVGQGFRDTNAWLAALTGSVFPKAFYVGDGLGSFNSWMRLFSGVTFGLAVVRFALPYIDGTPATSYREDRAAQTEADVLPGARD